VLENGEINLKNLASKLPGVLSESHACGEVVRPTAVSLAASLKQEPSPHRSLGER